MVTNEIDFNLSVIDAWNRRVKWEISTQFQVEFQLKISSMIAALLKPFSYQFNLNQLITEDTRIAKTSFTLLDHICINDNTQCYHFLFGTRGYDFYLVASFRGQTSSGEPNKNNLLLLIVISQ